MRSFFGCVLVVLAGLGAGLEASPPGCEAGKVAGRLTLELPGVKLADVRPIVVFLDASAGRLSYSVPPKIPVISQKNARFSPPFMAIAAGQTVELDNDDRIVHNVFSYSPPKRFDLGLYPAGETRRVTFDKPGVTDLFCSIHSKMNATIFVAPSPYFSEVEPDGAFEIEGIPPGRYVLKTWCRKLPGLEQTIEVSGAGVTSVRLSLDGGAH